MAPFDARRMTVMTDKPKTPPRPAPDAGAKSSADKLPASKKSSADKTPADATKDKLPVPVAKVPGKIGEPAGNLKAREAALRRRRGE